MGHIDESKVKDKMAVAIEIMSKVRMEKSLEITLSHEADRRIWKIMVVKIADQLL